MTADTLLLNKSTWKALPHAQCSQGTLQIHHQDTLLWINVTKSRLVHWFNHYEGLSWYTSQPDLEKQSDQTIEYLTHHITLEPIVNDHECAWTVLYVVRVPHSVLLATAVFLHASLSGRSWLRMSFPFSSFHIKTGAGWKLHLGSFTVYLRSSLSDSANGYNAKMLF